MFENIRRAYRAWTDPKPFFIPPSDCSLEFGQGPRTWLDVETHNGVVVAVWYHCTQVPFQQIPVDMERARSMVLGWDDLPELVNVEVDYA